MLFTVALFALLVLGALVFILQPLVSGVSRFDPVRGERERLLREKRQALLLLRDLDFDRETGKILESDYAASRAEGEVRALETLRALDALDQGEAIPDDALEEEIRKLRARIREEMGNAV